MNLNKNIQVDDEVPDKIPLVDDVEQIPGGNESGEGKSEAQPTISGGDDMEQIPEVNNAEHAKEENMLYKLHGNCKLQAYINAPETFVLDEQDEEDNIVIMMAVKMKYLWKPHRCQ